MERIFRVSPTFLLPWALLSHSRQHSPGDLLGLPPATPRVGGVHPFKRAGCQERAGAPKHFLEPPVAKAPFPSPASASPLPELVVPLEPFTSATVCSFLLARGRGWRVGAGVRGPSRDLLWGLRVPRGPWPSLWGMRRPWWSGGLWRMFWGELFKWMHTAVCRGAGHCDDRQGRAGTWH